LYPLAREISHRWLATVAALYEHESKLVEKYAIALHPDGALGGGGGEYPLQDGFGWTNGITCKLLVDNPGHHAHGARAATRRR
jgi:alpha,alpha-trehalase